MTKTEYIKQLEFSLNGKLSKPEISEILRDYSEYFAEGSRAGKTEEEIAINLGIPSVAARTLLENDEESAAAAQRDKVEKYWDKLKSKWQDFTASSACTGKAYGGKAYNSAEGEHPESDYEQDGSEQKKHFNSGGAPKKPLFARFEFRKKSDGYSSPGSNTPPQGSAPHGSWTPPQGDAQHGSYSSYSPYYQAPPKPRKSFLKGLLAFLSAVGMVTLVLFAIPIGIFLMFVLGLVVLGVATVLLGLLVAFVALLVGGVAAISLFSLGSSVVPASFIVIFILSIVFCLAGSVLSICLIVYLFKLFFSIVRACFGRRRAKHTPPADGYYSPPSADYSYPEPEPAERRYKPPEAPYKSPFYPEENAEDFAPTEPDGFAENPAEATAPPQNVPPEANIPEAAIPDPIILETEIPDTAASPEIILSTDPELEMSGASSEDGIVLELPTEPPVPENTPSEDTNKASEKERQVSDNA